PDDSLPQHCWVRGLSEPMPSHRKHRPSVPPPLESLSLLPIGMRVGRYIHRERKAGRLPIFDLSLPLMQPPNPGPYAGVPLGGMGGGCIGRGFRGDFRRWNIWPGRYRSQAVLADQFSVRCRAAADATGGSGGPESAPRAAVLSTETADAVDPELRSWAWGMDPACCTYAALYPRAWHIYDRPVDGVRLACRQVSPVFPNEYRRTSVPACVFEWTVENLTNRPMEVSLMFTFQNGTGLPNDAAGGHSNRPFTAPAWSEQSSSANEPPKGAKAAAGSSAAAASSGMAEAATAATAAVGVELTHRHRSRKVYEMDIEHEPLTFALAAAATDPAVSISRCAQFATGYHGQNGGAGGAAVAGSGGDALALRARDVWKAFLLDGALPERFENGGSGGGGDGFGGGDDSGGDSGVNAKAGGLKGRGCSYSPHRARTSAAGEAVAAALCQKVTVPARGKKKLAFALAWDMPLARFGSGHALPR
ncbi:unnamed protein product, partial [Phaeothamnion confervicola]